MSKRIGGGDFAIRPLQVVATCNDFGTSKYHSGVWGLKGSINGHD